MVDEEYTENDAEFEPLADDPYPWAADDDERRRAFVLDNLAAVGEVPPEMVVGLLDEIYKWLRDGTAPSPNAKPKHLRPV
jgi:hypothetical protein